MKKMLFFLALIVSTNLFGQNGIYQPISKPDNEGCYNLYFNEDSTMKTGWLKDGIIIGITWSLVE